MAVDTPMAPPATVSAIEITAARLPPWAGDPAFSVTRLDASTVQATPRLDEALSEVPGVDLFRRNSSLGANPTTQGMSMRGITGSGAGRSLVTLDGVPLNDPFGNWVIWSGVPAASLSGVDIVRGAGAGPYGAGALTGVVALDERSSSTPWFYVDGTYGELGDRQASAAGETNLGPFRVMAVASGEHSDGYVPIHQGLGPADTKLTLDSGSVAGRIEADLAGGVLSARLAYNREARASGLAGTIAGQPGSASSTHGYLGSLTYAKAPVGDAFGYRLQVWNHQTQLTNSAYSVAAVAGIRTTTALTNNEFTTPARETGLNGALRRSGSDWTLELGGDYRATRGHETELFGGSPPVNFRHAGGEQLVEGAYLEGTKTLGAWLFAAGARDDHWESTNSERTQHNPAGGQFPGTFVDQFAPDRSGDLPTGRLGARYDFGNGLSARAAAYEGFRLPSLNELHRPFTVGNVVTEANPGLTPEKLNGYEIGFNGVTGIATWSLTAFNNQLEDPITNVTLCVGTCSVPLLGYTAFNQTATSTQTLKQRRNGPTVKATGVEGDIALKVLDGLTLKAAGSYTDAKQGSLRPAQAAKVSATGGFDWQAAPAMRVSLDARYEGSRFEDDLNSIKLKASTTLDGRVDFMVGRMADLYLAGDNLLDADVQTGVSAASGTNFYNYGPPRQVRIGLTLRR
ncbi:MAG: TonB-dependent receptor [Caulobacteraceae bacterium]|nr:TonB-dependent receptor [Caulobacteraceae bacterium]